MRVKEMSQDKRRFTHDDCAHSKEGSVAGVVSRWFSRVCKRQKR